MKRVLEYIAADDYIDKSIKTLLKSYFKISSGLISTLKKTDDGITVNGIHQNVTYLLRKNDWVRITVYEKEENKILPTKINFEVLYEDEDIMAVNKPPFVPTHPSVGNYENTLANGVIYYWNQKNEHRLFRAVNRLDKNTSGVMLIAKNSYAHARLCDMLHTDKLKRKYTALVEGEIEYGGTVEAPIAREKESIIKRCVREDGQKAVTHYRIIKKYSGYTLLEIELETGRTHQIRVHMSYIGHPIVCDFLYGSEENIYIKRQALHSSYISFIHPVTQKNICIECKLPEDIADFVGILNEIN